MHRLVRCELEHSCWRTRGEDVSFTDVKIKIPGPGDRNDVLHRKRAQRILGDLKKSQLRTRLRTGRADFRGSLRPDEFVRYGRRTCFGGRWESQNRKNVYLSPYVKEPLNSKVIKSYVPELRSRVFRVSGFLCSMYICYEHSMYVSHIRIMGMDSDTCDSLCTWKGPKIIDSGKLRPKGETRRHQS